MKTLSIYLRNKGYRESIIALSAFAILIDLIILIFMGIIINSSGDYLEQKDSPVIRILLGDEMEKSGFIPDLISGGIIAPIIETIFFHVPFISLLRKFPVDKKFILVITTVTFSALHVFNGLIALLLTLPGSFLIAYAYLRYIDLSFNRALLGAMIVHGLANTGLICLGYTYDYLIQ